MSSRKQNGWYVVKDHRVLTERERIRVQEVKERFKRRAENDNKMKHAMELKIRIHRMQKDIFEIDIKKLKEEIFEFQSAIMKDREIMRKYDLSAQEARNCLASKDEMINSVLNSQPVTVHSLILRTVKEVEDVIKEDEHFLIAYPSIIQQLEAGIKECEERKRNAVISATKAKQDAQKHQKIVDETQGILLDKIECMREIESMLRQPWATLRNTREMMYIQDIFMYLTDNLDHNTFIISSPILEPDAMCPRMVKGPYVTVQLSENLAFGKVYIQCMPETCYGRFDVHVGSYDTMNHTEDIELTLSCDTEMDVFDRVNEWKESSHIHHR